MTGDIADFVNDPKSKGTIVVAFGTVVRWAQAPETKILAMANALKRLNDYRIIWSFINCTLDLPKHIRVMEWIPQNDLLFHNKTKLFISHGGLKR